MGDEAWKDSVDSRPIDNVRGISLLTGIDYMTPPYVVMNLAKFARARFSFRIASDVSFVSISSIYGIVRRVF